MSFFEILHLCLDNDFVSSLGEASRLLLRGCDELQQGLTMAPIFCKATVRPRIRYNLRVQERKLSSNAIVRDAGDPKRC